ncbi:major facilitator superfamily domain-containing protein, partial [Crepidotus variabilis]
RTQLPFGQLSILLFLRFCESASTSVIYPFLDELLAWITGEHEKVGYYAGTMEFIRQVVSLAVVMFWSQASDHVGRKPILFLGTFALATSTISFGISKAFWALVMSRCIFTGLNSNSGVIKGMIREITDESNNADAFAFLHAPWAIGYAFGAFVGGSLARPHTNFPSIFPGTVWKIFPYLLPCLIMGCLSGIGCLFISIFLREVCYTPNEPLLHSSEREQSSASPEYRQNEAPPPLRTLLTRPVVVACGNYCILGALHVSFNTLQPLFLAMPAHLGGLALAPPSIGYILATYGVFNALGQTFLLGRFVRLFGAKKVFMSAVAALIPLFLLPLAMNTWVRAYGFSWHAKAMLFIELACLFVVELGYGSVYIFINASAPNKRALGAVNGMGQTMVSV